MRYKITRATLEHLIFTRVCEWGKASNLVPLGNDPILKVNPHGAVAIYFDKLHRDFWKYKFEAFDMVCGVDGA